MDGVANDVRSRAESAAKVQQDLDLPLSIPFYRRVDPFFAKSDDPIYL